VDVVDLLILALRLAFVALLYLFLLLVLRMAIGGLRAPVALGRPGQTQRLRLLVVEPGESTLSAGQILEAGDHTTLGRADRADVVLVDTAISAEHAQLSRNGRTWTVTDLGSTNGTRVNDTLVSGRASLSEGDVLGLGTVRLKVLPRQS
jgi:pSer/pThr/pTyr-binding forkhead associated (FHA) protein